jgi:homoserine kinase type II
MVCFLKEMKISNKEIKEIVSNWNIKKIKKIKFSGYGEVNYNWLIETEKEKYFLRRFEGSRSLKDLNFEINYLKTLQRNDFSYKTPNPCKTKKGKYVIKFQEKYYWLDNFIKGKIKKRLRKNELKQIAEMLSQYHNILESLNLRCDKEDNKDMSANSVLKEIKSFINKLKKNKKLTAVEKIYLHETKKIIPILRNIQIKEYSKLKKYAIHRDLNPENLLWRGNRLSGVLDFENVSQGNDCFIKDICVIFQYGASKKNRLNIAKAKFFINEYKKYRKLENREIKLIPEIMAAGYIEDFEYQYWKVENDKGRATPQRLKIYSEAAQLFWKNKDKLRGALDEV